MTDNLLIYFLIFLLFILCFKISKKILKIFFLLLLGVFFAISVSGCSQGNLTVNNSLEAVEENTLTRVQDIPFYKGSKVEIERSLIMGEGKSWSGQLTVFVPGPKNEVFNFYVRNLSNFNWKEQTTIRGETSILNYVGENNRVIIVSITEKFFGNSEVLISVSPYTEEFEEKVGDFINEKYLEITE